MTNATLFTQPGCGGCIFAAKDLTKAGVPYTERNVRTDEAAAEMVQELYREHREPGKVPETPVIVIDGEPYFGAVELHAYLRELRQGTAA
ncbi:glutaredoxin [Mycobacteroides abscessus subsp. massiliense]|uniref:glutaredoxin family protein n=1 Tax=Mycobacteroides abscessus TaxID=36809 RepID=UPI0009A80162|nr:glutaredoxin family protein [Mycobacteroides abscessus]SLH42300.1 glutaredoxin [Mycobacteroides abscessus subsp. massiliense]